MASSSARTDIPVTPLTYHVLIALAGGPRHGYAIIKDIESRTGGAMRPATGTMYLALRRLREDGLIAEAQEEHAADERRRYYRITARGRKAAGAEARRMAAMVEAAVSRNLVGADILRGRR